MASELDTLDLLSKWRLNNYIYYWFYYKHKNPFNSHSQNTLLTLLAIILIVYANKYLPRGNMLLKNSKTKNVHFNGNTIHNNFYIHIPSTDLEKWALFHKNKPFQKQNSSPKNTLYSVSWKLIFQYGRRLKNTSCNRRSSVNLTTVNCICTLERQVRW
jgi:hypothetical protein